MDTIVSPIKILLKFCRHTSPTSPAPAEQRPATACQSLHGFFCYTQELKVQDVGAMRVQALQVLACDLMDRTDEEHSGSYSLWCFFWGWEGLVTVTVKSFATSV